MKIKEMKEWPICEAASSVKKSTANWRVLRPVVIKKCGDCPCAQFCPDSAISIKGGKVVIDYNYCKGCGICARECPHGSIIMQKEEK
jgi:2-oxoacid:acceptor oxidoreductase delta subunit (pyruvate/2-ketoisovalerate family)